MAKSDTPECIGFFGGQWRRSEIISLASLLLVVLMAGLGYFYGIDNRLIKVEQQVQQNTKTISTLGNVNESLAKLTERTEATREDVKDIKRIVMELMKNSK